MFKQLYIKFFILETDYDYKCSIAKELFVSRLINFGSVLSSGRKLSQNEADIALNQISKELLPGLPEYWISLHTYNCLLLKNKWSDSVIFKEYLKYINRFRKKRGLIPDEIFFDEEILEIENRPKELSSFVIELVRQSDFSWDTEYFSNEMYDFLYDSAYSKIRSKISEKKGTSAM